MLDESFQFYNILIDKYQLPVIYKYKSVEWKVPNRSTYLYSLLIVDYYNDSNLKLIVNNNNSTSTSMRATQHRLITVKFLYAHVIQNPLLTVTVAHLTKLN